MLELATRVGDRQNELRAHGGLSWGYYYLGDWESAEAEAHASGELHSSALAPIRIARGDVALVREEFDNEMAGRPEGWDEQAQPRAFAGAYETEILLAEVKPAEALARAEASLEDAPTIGLHYFAGVIEVAAAAAAQLGNEAKLVELLALVEAMPPGHRTPEMVGVAALTRARLAAVRGEDAEADFREATEIMRALEFPFMVARFLVEHGEWRVSTGKHAEPLLEEAQQLLMPLRATVWLERVERARAGAGAAVA
jgi:hypothetical protein